MHAIKITMNIQTPRVPNFLLIGDGDQKVPVAAVAEDGLRAIGKQWTEDLIARARDQAKDLYHK